MSIKCKVEELTLKERNTIVTKLQFNKKENPRFKSRGVSATIYPYFVDDDNEYTYLPMNWALNNIACAKRPERTDFVDNFPSTFKGQLRPIQKEVKVCLLILRQDIVVRKWQEQRPKIEQLIN